MITQTAYNTFTTHIYEMADKTHSKKHHKKDKKEEEPSKKRKVEFIKDVVVEDDIEDDIEDPEEDEDDNASVDLATITHINVGDFIDRYIEDEGERVRDRLKRSEADVVVMQIVKSIMRSTLWSDIKGGDYAEFFDNNCVKFSPSLMCVYINGHSHSLKLVRDE